MFFAFKSGTHMPDVIRRFFVIASKLESDVVNFWLWKLYSASQCVKKLVSKRPRWVCRPSFPRRRKCSGAADGTTARFSVFNIEQLVLNYYYCYYYGRAIIFHSSLNPQMSYLMIILNLHCLLYSSDMDMCQTSSCTTFVTFFSDKLC